MPLLTKKQISEVYRRLEEHNPNPQGELNFTNIYTLLIAVLMSAQATDVSINKATKQLFKIADTPKKMLELGEEKLKEHIKTINLYPTKAKRIIALSEILLNDYNGEVPDSREELIKLPGVGRKTANVVLNLGFKKATIAVDTHILRTAPRLGLSNGKKPIEVEEDLLRLTPPQYLLHAHHWILLHGRYICKARTPDCDNCFLSDLCQKNNL